MATTAAKLMHANTAKLIQLSQNSCMRGWLAPWRVPSREFIPGSSSTKIEFPKQKCPRKVEKEQDKNPFVGLPTSLDSDLEKQHADKSALIAEIEKVLSPTQHL